MSEFEPELLEYRLSVPPKVASLPIPRLDAGANDAIARADEAMAGLQVATVEAGLDVSPLLAGVLTRLEAVSSSQIEDLDADLETELVRDHGDFDTVSTEAALVRHNIAIVASAVTHADRVTVKWLTDLHRRLMVGSDLSLHHIGAFRDCPVWIGRTRASADFEGPPHGEVDEMIGDLIDFVGRADVHHVVQAAVAHAQFETIHPFVDGNGRVGRALVHPVLRRGASGVIVPASHALLARRDAYFAGLNAYRSGHLNEWVQEFADAVSVAARAGTSVTVGLANLSRSWEDEIRTHRDGTTRAILESLTSDPVVTVASARALRNVSQPAALNAIAKLVDAAILRPTTVDTPGRAHVWVAGGVLDVLAGLERQIGARST